MAEAEVRPAEAGYADEDEARVAEFVEGVKRGIEQFETGQVKTFDDKAEFLNLLRTLERLPSYEDDMSRPLDSVKCEFAGTSEFEAQSDRTGLKTASICLEAVINHERRSSEGFEF